MQDLAVLWGIGGAKDITRWQWEAPFPSATSISTPVAKETTAQLPAWLMQHGQATIPEETLIPRPRSLEMLEIGNDSAEKLDGGDHLAQFLESLRSTTTSDAVLKACEHFNQNFRQSLYLGQVSDDVLAASIFRVPNDILNHAASKDFKDDACMSFFQAVWEGITTSKVLRLTDLGIEVLRLLLTTLPLLPVHKSAAFLADVLNSITDCQRQQLMQEICAIGNLSFGSVTIHPAPGKEPTVSKTTCPRHPPSRDDLVFDIKALEQFVDSLGTALGKFSSRKIPEHVRDLARMSTSYVARGIFHKYSSSLKQAESEGGVVGQRPSVRSERELRKTWLKLIARMPYTSEGLLMEACRIMEADVCSNGRRLVPHVSVYDLCDILLEYWISKDGDRTSMVKARASFKAAALKQGTSNSIVHLCRSLELHSVLWRKKVQCALGMLRRIRGVRRSSYFFLRSLEDAQVYLPATVLEDEMKWLSKSDIKHARYLFDKFSTERPQTDSLGLEAFPDLAIAMIHDPTCNTDEVWRALGGRNIWLEDQISNARIDLVQRMAYEFSQTKCITSRDALRNVDKCYRYLSYHRIPISSDLARIMTHVGIERHIWQKGSVSEGRLQWILGIVARAESKRVAKILEATVVFPRDREQWHRKRDRNLFKTGPID